MEVVSGRSFSFVKIKISWNVSWRESGESTWIVNFAVETEVVVVKIQKRTDVKVSVKMKVLKVVKDTAEVQALKGFEMSDEVYVINWAGRLKWMSWKKWVPVHGYKLKDEVS